MISKGALAARVMVGLAALALGALVIRDGLVGQIVQTPPQALVSVAQNDPRALAAAADKALAAAKTPNDLHRASDLASRALAIDVTQVNAVRDLGMIAARRGDGRLSMRLMSLAGRRSPLDGVTHLWLMGRRLDLADYDEAFADADDLLRHAPNLTPALTPVLVAYAAPGRAALASRLATNPPWRLGFLIALAAQARDPGVVQAILSDLQQTPSTPTSEEWSAYFARRVKDQAYELAYLDWLKTLPPAALAQARSVYDGDFGGGPGVPPFNWRLGGGLGGQADLGRVPISGNRLSDKNTRENQSLERGALHVRYDGYGAPELAEQLLVLAPGAYWLSGEARASGDASAALAWTIACAEAPNTVLARAPAPNAAGDWRGFSVEVDVPEGGCAAQWLRLTPSPTDYVRPLEVWYRGLVVDRLE